MKTNQKFSALLFMFFLRNVYLNPNKFTLSTRRKYLWKLYDAGLITSKDGIKVIVTPRGKNYLRVNLVLLTPEEEQFKLEAQMNLQQECVEL
jgi:hypothetical protein